MVAVANSPISTSIGPGSTPQRSQAPARSGDWLKWIQVPTTYGGLYPAIGELVINGRKCTVAEHVDEGGMRYVCVTCGAREWIVAQNHDGEWFATNDDETMTMARAIEAAYKHIDPPTIEHEYE